MSLVHMYCLAMLVCVLPAGKAEQPACNNEMVMSAAAMFSQDFLQCMCTANGYVPNPKPDTIHSTSTIEPATTPQASLIYGSSKKTWYDAQAYCQGLGGELVSITSEQRQSEVQAVIASNGNSEVEHWIGLNDRGTEGTFVWSDGTSGPFQNWVSGQPDNGRGNGNGPDAPDVAEDCVFMNAARWQHQWVDYHCRNLNRFLCSV